jgi:subtilisin family serine protease
MKRIVITTCLMLLLGVGITDLSSRQAGAQDQVFTPIKKTTKFVRGRVLVRFQSQIRSDHARQIIAAMGGRDSAEIEGIGVHIVDLPYQASEHVFLRAFMNRPEVEFAELDHLLRPEQTIPNDPLFNNLNSWSLPKIDAPAAWSLNTGSANIIIAILDTGVDASHPDLASQMVSGWNVYNNNSDTSDVQGHGTAVAGAAAAASNNGIGVSSVAWGCRIMPVRISDLTGMAPESTIASGLSWASAHGARIANISYYITGSRTISSAAKNFQDRGGVVVAAAGNYGVAETVADDPAVITVGATDSLDNLYSWSNHGRNLDVVAPGSVYTTARGGIYGVGSGTSFASPAVAGVAALLLSGNSFLTPRQVEAILKQNADDLGEAGWDSVYGFGRINAGRAVAAGLSDPDSSDTLPPVITIMSPNSGAAVSGTVNVQVAATDDVGVTKGELYVDNVLVATSTTAPFTLKWNTRKVRAGQHALHSKAYDAAGNVGGSSPVIVYK